MTSHVISVTSGKGGVGKTLSTVHLAYLAQSIGLKTLILDGDLGLSNVDIIMGLRPRFTIRDILDGNARIEDIIVEDPSGVQVISSGSGISSLSHLNQIEKSLLRDHCIKLTHRFNMTFIDTGAGISDNVISLNSFSDKVLVVTTPEPHSMTDAYAIMKVLSEKADRKLFYLLVNQTRTKEEGLNVFDRLADVSNKFLAIKIKYLGSVPFDREVSLNVFKRKIPFKTITQTLSGQAWQQALYKLIGDDSSSTRSEIKLSDIWNQILHHSNNTYI